MQLTINPEFHKLIPPLSREEREQLEANLLRDGCRDSLVVGMGAILDGHNRYEICQRHGLPFRVKALDLKDDIEARVWIIRNQFGRRNLSSYDRAVLALKLEPLVQPSAKQNQRLAKGKGLQKSANLKVQPIDTREEIAAAARVSHDTIAKVKVIEAKAAPEVKEAIRAGETSINAEYKKLTVHVGQNTGENEWYTPPEFIAAAVATMGRIDVDPASSATANKTVGARTFFTADQNGLEQAWRGRVWMNPPYAQPLISQFAEAMVAKFKSKEVCEACVLVNNATETMWFQGMLEAASAVCLIRGRVRFLDALGNPGAPLQGQAVIYLGPKPRQFASGFGELGAVLFHEL